MENKLKHLEMIQGVISRMAANSFALKGWAVALVTGIFILSDKQADKTFFLVAYIPTAFFWLLDAYYLALERLYRGLYDQIRKIDNDSDIDFSMKIKKVNLVNCLSAFISISEVIFYAPLCVVVAGIVII